MSLNLLFTKKFTFHHVWCKVKIYNYNTKRALVCEINWSDFRTNFNWVAWQKCSPVNVFGTNYYRFFIFSVSQNSQVKWLIQLDHKTWVKLWCAMLTFKFKNKSVIEWHLTGSSDVLCMISFFQKTDCNRNLFIISWINKVNKCSCLNNIAAQMSLVWIECFQIFVILLGRWLACSCSGTIAIGGRKISSSSSSHSFLSWQSTDNISKNPFTFKFLNNLVSIKFSKIWVLCNSWFDGVKKLVLL